MKTVLLAIMTLAVASCTASPKARPESPRSGAAASMSPREVDMTSMMGKEVTVQALLKECVAQTGMNVTYDSGTAKELDRTFVRWSNRARLPVQEFETLVGELLRASGFELSPIGPAELRVFSVERIKR